VRLVVADTGPVHYLILIGHIDVLASLFERIIIPSVVRDELTHAITPAMVRNWMDNPPAWVEIREAVEDHSDDTSLRALDSGEKAAIALATSIQADLILIDDREGATVARCKGFAVTGTLGVLDLAAQRGLVNLTDVFARLKATNFRYPLEIMDELLKQRKKGR
jgi:predicted nucleic acid-binding protein